MGFGACAWLLCRTCAAGQFESLVAGSCGGVSDTFLAVRTSIQIGAPQQKITDTDNEYSYHYPGVTNNIAVTTETYNLLAQHPKIVGAKLSHGDLSQFTQITQSPLIKGKTEFNMFCGLGQLLLPVLLLGGSGVIDGLASVFPKSIVHLYGLASKRDLTFEDREKALKVQYMVSCAEEIFGRWGIIGVKDAIHKYLGMGNLDGGRNPIAGNLGEEGWKQFKVAFDNLKALEDTL